MKAFAFVEISAECFLLGQPAKTEFVLELSHQKQINKSDVGHKLKKSEKCCKIHLARTVCNTQG